MPDRRDKVSENLMFIIETPLADTHIRIRSDGTAIHHLYSWSGHVINALLQF